MSFVVLERVNKVFLGTHGQRVHALRDFSLAVAERELLVLLGPSGSGKTTTLRLIAGLDEPTSGSIHISGADMNRVPPKNRDVAMVFQHHALYPHMTVRGNLEFGLRLRKVPRTEIEARTQEMAGTLELVQVLDAFPAELSGGQRQRVALGRALIRRPKVLLCDEPLSQLDPPLRAQLRAELLRLRERLAVTVIYVTHDQAEAMTLGDRLAVMHEGVLHQVDKPQGVYEEPTDLFVAGFIGTPPMNLIQGAIVSQHGALWFREKCPSGGDGLSLPVDARHLAQIRLRLDQAVVLGVRPEHLRPVVEVTGAGHTIVTRILLVERMGPDVWLHCDTGAHRLAVRAPGSDQARPGERIRLLFDPAQVRYFDPVTHLALQ